MRQTHPNPTPRGPHVKLRALVTDEGRYVPMQFIESINFIKPDTEDSVVDVLKGKHTLDIHTLSGENYKIDMGKVSGKLGADADMDIDSVWEIVFESWIYYISL